MRHHVRYLAIAAAVVAACAAPPAPSPSVAPVPSTAVVSATAALPTAVLATPAPTRTPLPIPTPGESWVVFQTNSAAGYGVHLIRPDGSGFHRWPSGIAGTHEHPSWSSDGERILLNTVDPDGTEDLWIGNADGTDAQLVLDCVDPCLWADEPAWSPDDRKVAFQRLVADGDGFRSTLEILDVATGDVTVVLTMPDLEIILAPRWSPNGESMVVEVVHLPEASLEVDPDGGGIGIVDLTAATPVVDLIAPLDTFAQSPDWSPVDDLIVFAQPTGPDQAAADIVAVRPDGTGRRNVTDVASDRALAVQPAFTPDGQRVLFVLTRPGRQETVMAVVGIDGSALGPIGGSDYRDGFHPRLRPTP